jgi:hypothetical protein
MRGMILMATVMTAIGAAGPALGQANCLPRSAIQTQDSLYGPGLELGLVAGSVTLCISRRPDVPHGAGCWTINPTTGALTASTVTALPGRSQAGAVDAAGCVAGYCPTPRAEADRVPLWAINTNGTRAVVLSMGELHVFDATSKAPLRTIPLAADDVPGHTIVGNAPIRLLYLDDTIHVVGADAGPFAAIWSFRDSGVRLGRQTTDGRVDGHSINVYRGGTSIIDGRHVALADAALRRLVIFDAAGKRTTIDRQVSPAPCSEENLEDVFIAGGSTRVSAACRRTIATHFAPYYDVDLVRMPSGAFLAALSGKHAGEIAVLDKTTLREVRRLKLARCGR